MLHDRFQHTRELCGTALADDLLWLGLILLDDLAVAVDDLDDGRWLHVHAFVGEGTIGTYQFQRRHAFSEATDGRSEVHIVLRTVFHKGRDARLLGVVNRLFDTHFFGKFNGRYIQRMLSNLAHGHIAVPAAVKVHRRPAIDFDGAVLDNRVRRIFIFECRRKHERLERRTRLTHSHRSTVELIRAAAADHRLDIARMRVDSY